MKQKSLNLHSLCDKEYVDVPDALEYNQSKIRTYLLIVFEFHIEPAGLDHPSPLCSCLIQDAENSLNLLQKLTLNLQQRCDTQIPLLLLYPAGRGAGSSSRRHV